MAEIKHLEKLQQRIGYQFQDIKLLKMALTHRSFSNKNNERLEFLGDSLLGATISQKLYRQFPEAKEGMLSRLRSSLVKGETLAEMAREFSLGDYLFLGDGELKSGGHRRSSILADTVEAIIGAIFLDGGTQQCQTIINQWFHLRLIALSADKPLQDSKTELQELLQAHKKPLPIYQLLATKGASHQTKFTVSCSVELLDTPFEATASSRRQAEKSAASLVLEVLKKQRNLQRKK